MCSRYRSACRSKAGRERDHYLRDEFASRGLSDSPLSVPVYYHTRWTSRPRPCWAHIVPEGYESPTQCCPAPLSNRGIMPPLAVRVPSAWGASLAEPASSRHQPYRHHEVSVSDNRPCRCYGASMRGFDNLRPDIPSRVGPRPRLSAFPFTRRSSLLPHSPPLHLRRSG